MARLSDIDEELAAYLVDLPCPVFETPALIKGPPLNERRVAIVSTAGLQRRGDQPFAAEASDYRIIPGDCTGGDIVMSHVSVEFDRTGFQQDLNVVFPIDRLHELARDGKIGSVADFHYSVMGATPPEELEEAAHQLSGFLKADAVDAVLLVPV